MDCRRAYLDSSVVLRRLLQQPGCLTGWAQWAVMASELLYVEVRRTLNRYHSEGLLTAEALAQRIEEFQALLAAMDQVPISRQILDRAAGPLPAPVRTLDAIHLATAMAWAETSQEEVMFLTHDRQLATAARVCGLRVYPQLV